MDTEREWPERPDATPLPPGDPRRREPGPLGTRETSGIQVRLGDGRTVGPRQAERHRRERERERDRKRRRAGLIGMGIAAGAVAAVLIGVVMLLPGQDTDVPPAPQTANDTASAAMPPTGAPIEVATADGSKYRIAVVRGGVDDRAVTSQQSPPPAGMTYAFIEYALSNPASRSSLLDFPGDVFLKRDLVAEQARGRCVWQPGVPEDMCTPPVRSTVVRRLAGAELQAGDGGDRYLAAGSAYLVRATVEVPVSDQTKATDLRLYVWKQLYMADQLAKEAPFPR